MSANRNTEVSIKILKILGTGVLFTAASVLVPAFPYVVLKKYLKQYFQKRYHATDLRNSVAYLKRRKFVALSNNRFILTKLGRKYLKRKSLRVIKIKKVPWDNKWRIVTFDIPQEKVVARNAFRSHLQTMGFFHFQRSVFIIPYPCEREVDQLVEDLGIEEYVFILVADRFNNDRQIIKKFI